jgi:hypothetical protein
MAVTMGSKRNSVKVGQAVDKAVENENNQPLEEEKKVATETKAQSKRQSTKKTEVANERPATKKRLRGDRPSSGFWYLQDTADLEGVTAEPTNEELGLREIKVFDPSDAQWDNGVVALVTIETIIGQVKGIQVMDSNRDNSIYIRLQSRSYERDGQKQYVNDLTLDRKIQAQILRYIDSLLEDVQ